MKNIVVGRGPTGRPGLFGTLSTSYTGTHYVMDDIKILNIVAYASTENESTIEGFYFYRTAQFALILKLLQILRRNSKINCNIIYTKPKMNIACFWVRMNIKRTYISVFSD